ncbi:P-loop containing nucleoside triphosphate hydrolase protein [Aspergillus steynii IBT 23096]|uniref:P-loop containing nucleoside triphosphate hydrolase protein n=1 Tax=Aspergillus steynii IBT 23096 TaxID=1392250 RepID=A0A2I2FYX8_9EURO|nr:P-loop containing nucleoside triphosphate hydrolase protein [Aspergillus steynii IBT 23096]PLB45842.1 P-loop containing nucleoside triphosphate hydrolase protein [Aspergillus steynii IBT 23096]
MAAYEVHDPTFKLALLGDAAVGKTSFKFRHFTGEEIKEHHSVNYCEISHPLSFTLEVWSVYFEIWDIASNQGSMNRLGEYLKDTDAAIIMFDVSRRKTWESVVGWYRELVSVNQKDIPVVVCGNKVDDREREVMPEDISWPDEMSGVQYCETSVKTVLNIDEPFLWLTRTLLGDQTLEWGTNLLCSGLVAPHVDTEMLQMYQEEMKKAGSMPLPDNDSDL